MAKLYRVKNLRSSAGETLEYIRGGVREASWCDKEEATCYPSKEAFEQLEFLKRISHSLRPYWTLEVVDD